MIHQFGFVEAVDGFGQGIVVRVPFAADRGLDACFGQPLGVADGNVLASPVRVMNQCPVTFGLSVIQRLFKRIQDKIGTH